MSGHQTMPSGLQTSSEISLCLSGNGDLPGSNSLSSTPSYIPSTGVLSNHLPTSSINTSSVSFCGLSAPYESRLVPSAYSRINGIYGSSHYTDNNYMTAFATGHSSLYSPLVRAFLLIFIFFFFHTQVTLITIFQNSFFSIIRMI